MKRLILAFTLFSSLASVARPLIPLMPPPPRTASRATTVTTKRTTVASTRTTAAQTYYPSAATRLQAEKTPLTATGYGFEVGVLGRANSTQSTIAGLQLLYGVRVLARIALMENIFLVPSLGAFYRRDGAGNAGVSEYLIEGGGSLYYNFWLARKLRFLVGGTVKAGYNIASISAGNSNSASAAEFRLRGGPAAGLSLGLSPDLSLTANVEFTIGTGDTARFQPGVAFGAIFYLP